MPFPIDVVDVFRRSEAAGEFADQAVAVGAKGVWFQLGVVDEDAFERTTAAGVPMVMDTCPAIEWRRTTRRPDHGVRGLWPPRYRRSAPATEALGRLDVPTVDGMTILLSDRPERA